MSTIILTVQKPNGPYSTPLDGSSVSLGCTATGALTYGGDAVLAIDATISSGVDALTIEVSALTFKVVKNEQWVRPGGLTWTLSGTTLTLSFLAPPSGTSEWCYEFDPTRPPTQVPVKISRP